MYFLKLVQQQTEGRVKVCVVSTEATPPPEPPPLTQIPEHVGGRATRIL